MCTFCDATRSAANWYNDVIGIAPFFGTAYPHLYNFGMAIAVLAVPVPPPLW